MRGPDLFDNDLARQVRRSTHRCDLVDVVYKKLPTHSVMGPGLRKIRIVGEPEADWSAIHGKEPREVIVLVYRLEPEAAEEVTLGVGVSHIQDRVERAHGHGAIITQVPSNCPGRSAASSVDGPRGGTAYGDAAGQRWCREGRCPYGPSGGASGDGASNGDAICLTSFVVRHQRLRQRGVHVRGPRVRWIEHAERPFPARPRWPSQVIWSG